MSDGYDPDLQLTNPLVSVADNARQQSRQTFNYNGSFTWEFIDNLKFKTEFGLDHYYNKDKRFYGVTTYNSRSMETISLLPYSLPKKEKPSVILIL